MTEVTVTELNEGKKELQKLIKLGEQAKKLANNPEFKELILEQFCVHECARYAQLSADPSLREADRENALAIAQAAGHIRRWLQVVGAMARNAEKEVGEIDEAILELRQDGQDEVEVLE